MDLTGVQKFALLGILLTQKTGFTNSCLEKQLVVLLYKIEIFEQKDLYKGAIFHNVVTALADKYKMG